MKNGGPAFPQPDTSYGFHFNGLSMRDYFAAKAMQCFASAEWVEITMSRPEAKHFTPELLAQFVAHKSYKYADAMLAARGGEATEESGK